MRSNINILNNFKSCIKKALSLNSVIYTTDVGREYKIALRYRNFKALKTQGGKVSEVVGKWEKCKHEKQEMFN